MKGLERIPSLKQLAGAYRTLAGAATKPVPEAKLALYAQWARFDPRLAEVCVTHVARHWANSNPVALNQALATQPWPAAAGPLFEFAAKEVPHVRLALFRLWAATALEGFAPARHEQYYIGSRTLAGHAMVDDARFAMREYVRWGYLARESLYNKARHPGTYDRATRLRILRELASARARVRVADYWNALGRSVSRRQAERDLAGCDFLRPVGRTKGRAYVQKVR